MIRKAFVMFVKPGCEAEYERRHKQIWSELIEALHAHGIRNYSIFLDEPTHTLFGYVEVGSEERWLALVQTEVCQRWWRFMADIMPADANAAPVSRELKEVFHLA
ncbi:MAG TPA: L-rhamnose mutarotase [Steroidobacter sp.]